MYNNPIKKYQNGGVATTSEQDELLAAFVEWLPTKVKEFKGMSPEQIVQAINGMTKTEEGKKQVDVLMTAFQQDIKSSTSKFKQGGKIHQFLCKHAKGGHIAGCGCTEKKQGGGEVNYSREMYSSPDGIEIVERTPRLTRYITESDNGVRDTALYVKKSGNIYNSPFSRSYPGVPSRFAWKKANKEIDDARDADLLGKTNRQVDLSKLLNLNKSYINL